MNFEKLMDGQIAPALDFIPADFIAGIGDNPAAAREGLKQMTAAMAAMLPATQVKITERTIPGPNGDIPLIIYEPPTPAPRPALLWIHGGGYLVGSGRDDVSAVPFAEQANCTVVSVEYRLAPEHPFPAGPEDCYAALLWLVSNAAALGVDPERIALGGASAGGGMAAGVALMNRDRQRVNLVLQLLIYPMIDDTHETPSGHFVHHPKVWNRDVSMKAWKMYLGKAYGGEVSPYAAASRAKDVSGLPAAYICVGALDLFRDEDIEYASRLMAAGVPTELIVYPGGYHGFDVFAPMADVSQRMQRGYWDAVKRAFANAAKS